MKFIITILLLITNLALAQTCKLETEVRSSTPDVHFSDNGDGTILDNATGLMWQKCQLGLSGTNCDVGSADGFTWQQALTEALASNLAGYSNWRLPNITELESIVERRCYNPSINTNYFPNTSSSFFWSSSPYAVNPDFTAYVGFNYGYSFYDDRTDDMSVRLVRFVQAQPPQLGDYWLFYGDSETGGRADTIYTKSQAIAFETIWETTFGTLPQSHINGVGGASLQATSVRYGNRSDRDIATFINFQESGTQTRPGQMTAAEFAETFEAFVRQINIESPNAIISTETAYSFLSDERWVPYNDAMRLKIALLAQEGITVHLAEVDRDIKELISQTSFYSVALADNTHYTGLGNLMIAVSIYHALGFDVTTLDLSGVPDSEVSAADKQLVIAIAVQ